MLRFDADIFAEKPALVIWQVGTNAVFHKYNLDGVAAKIAEGLARLRQYPIDVVMMDPQYVTAMLLDERADASDRMVSLIASAAEKAGVSVFSRWALMRHWHVQNNISLERMLDPTDPDRLHQSDWSTQRVSVALCEAISKAPAARNPGKIRGAIGKICRISISRRQNQAAIARGRSSQGDWKYHDENLARPRPAAGPAQGAAPRPGGRAAEPQWSCQRLGADADRRDSTGDSGF
jgi:hypothetical protein